MADTTRPAPITDTSPEALKKLAREWVAALTPEERIAFLTVDHPAIPRLGLPAYRLEAEGAHGLVIRAGQSAMTESAETTVFPAPFGLSQTWDRELMSRIGDVISDEARVFNALVLYAPTIDLERDPRWGRNEEAYGEDPYLAGQLAIPLIKGLQGSEAPYLKTAATTKHFYANNYEFERDWDNSVVPEQLKRDYYLRPFEAAFIGGGATSAMAGYNAINGIIGMLNPEMNTLVRGEWGADGYFVSDGKAFEILPEFYGPFGYLGIDDDDWRAKWELSDDGETFRGKDGQEVNVKEVYARYAKAALDAGLDAFLAYDNDVVISAISKGVELGIIADADIERALVNQFQVMLRLGLVPGFGDNPYANTLNEKLLNTASAELVRRASAEAVVLLKNDGLLPLTGKSAEKIAVVGFVAGENQRDWYSGSPAYQVSPLDGIRAAFPNAEVSFDDGCDLVAFSRSDIGWLRVLDDGAVRYDGTEEQRSVFRAIDWGYGHAFQDVSTGKYLTTTESGELRTDAETVWSWFNRQLFFINQANVYSRSDFHAHPDGLAGIALTGTVNIDGGQFHPEIAFGEPAFPPGAARPGKNQYLKPYEPGAVETLNEILAKLTIHVVESGLERAADIAGQADAAVVVLGNHPLIGARECVDRLTTALPARWGELFETVAQANPEVVLTLIAGYQYAIGRQEARARAVLFTSQGMQEVGSAIGETLSGANNPSGRLSQTWYADNMQFGSLSNYDISDSKLTYQYLDSEPLHEFGFGLSYTTFQYSDLLLTENAEGVTVSFTLTNTGERPGAEVVQVYLVPKAPAQPTETPRPRKSLVQFDRVVLQSGESAAVTLLIDRRELSFWNANTNTFEREPGKLRLEVGASSEDIRLTGAITPVGLH